MWSQEVQREEEVKKEYVRFTEINKQWTQEKIKRLNGKLWALSQAIELFS